MKRYFQLLFQLVFLLSVTKLFAQTKFTHSHNDYNNPIPFYKAFYNGFNSIEADIFYVDGKLLVAHDKKSITAERSLKGLYLDPITYALRKDTARRLCLLIDVKDDYKLTLPALINELKPLAALLMTNDHPGRLKILISGNRPAPWDYENYPGLLFFDDDLIRPHTKAQWERVGQVSLDFSKYSKWRGIGQLPMADRQHIIYTIDSVHRYTGKSVRFWGAPDFPLSWDTQIDLGADIIGTDQLELLAAYLSKRGLLKPVTAIIPVTMHN